MIKIVKAAACCLSLLLLNILICGTPAFADERKYAMADNEALVYFCREKNDSTAVFALPYTYCVEITSSDGDWYGVKYAEDSGAYKQLSGYCRKNNLTVLEAPPENIYLNKQIAVTYSNASPAQSLPSLGDITVIASYYGVYYQAGVAYSYVYYNGSFGYISGANDDYPLNALPSSGTAIDNKKPDENKPEENKTSAKVILAVVLCALAAAALLIIYFTGKRKKFFAPKNK